MVSASRRAVSSSGRKAPDPTFTSSTRASVPSAIFLDMIELAMSGIGLDGRRHVAQGVELAVGRGTASSLAAQITAPTSRSWATTSSVRQRGPPAGDGLELVERAAGVAEAAARQLRDRRPARRHQRRQRQRHLVAHAAGRVLVDRRAGRPPDRSRRSPTSIIAAVQVASSPGAMSRQQDRHAQRGRLLVGDRAGGVALDEEAHLLVADSVPPSRLVRITSRMSVAISRVQVAGRPARTRPAATRPSARSLTSRSGPPASNSSWRHRPQQARSCAVGIGDRHRHQPPAARGVQRRHQTALGAQRQPVRGVLDVAAHAPPARRRPGRRRPTGKCE